MTTYAMRRRLWRKEVECEYHRPRSLFTSVVCDSDVPVAAWKFYGEKRSTLSWELTVSNIPWVFGASSSASNSWTLLAFSKPPILDASAPSGTMKFWWDAIVTTTSDSLDDRSFITHNTAWVDVRDVADSHIVSLEKVAQEANESMSQQGTFRSEWVNIVNDLDTPLLPGMPVLPFQKSKRSFGRDMIGQGESRFRHQMLVNGRNRQRHHGSCG
ncbi:hypothetical protein BKA70DRAFT_1301663 [Coprinopsis sp. MPI-PUGE-AT-0042]|nr:hypothetical protein BKA70DRAFT_1301663 [Coprinopsis sp. MPI-PUGE-AT-0042]